MNTRVAISIALFMFIFLDVVNSQVLIQPDSQLQTTILFQSETPLSISLKYSNREMTKETNDSIYITTIMAYERDDGIWDSLEVRLRARGNWRLKNCFIAPLKMRIKKAARAETVFEDNKEIKVVLPCRNTEEAHDYVLKEYMVYKLYEIVTPYHYKTRRIDLNYTDLRENKEKNYQLNGFLIEDITKVAERNSAKRLKKMTVHPLAQDDITAIQNDFFQFMIGNTDFSLTYQHNQKLLYKEGMDPIPVPYDFDMCGCVDARYAVVSDAQGKDLPITDVKQRLFLGFKRDPELFERVRQDYLSKYNAFVSVIDGMKADFMVEEDFDKTKAYLMEFFEILASDVLYNGQILSMARKNDDD